jgi:hypothetical protein
VLAVGQLVPEVGQGVRLTVDGGGQRGTRRGGKVGMATALGEQEDVEAVHFGYQGGDVGDRVDESGAEGVVRGW